MKRRKILSLAGAAGIAGIGGFFAWRKFRRPRLWNWSGVVFGTEGKILFQAKDETEASRTMEAVQREILRLEAIFTLYDGNSALRQLNRDGRLARPPAELLEALKICREVHEMTAGAFDPTIQPIWEIYDAHFNQHPDSAEGPPEAALEAARAKIGFERVNFGEAEISFEKPGMSLTLNGMAQGFLADKTAQFLLDRGISQALVNLGEYCALGPPSGEEAWKIGIESPNAPDEILDVIPLVYGGLATSGGYGYRFDSAGKFHHILDPGGQRNHDARRVITVEAPQAALADALATAGAVMDWEKFQRLQLPLLGLQFHRYEPGG